MVTPPTNIPPANTLPTNNLLANALPIKTRMPVVAAMAIGGTVVVCLFGCLLGAAAVYNRLGRVRLVLARRAACVPCVRRCS
jgi:hypothetical protein